MKKLILMSLMAVFAVGAANAADHQYWPVRMDSNPLYRPMEGRYYSITSLDTNTDMEMFSMGEEFGYGITDRMSVFMNTTGSYDSSDEPRYATKFSWDDLSLGMSYRYMDEGPWISDVYAKLQQRYNSSDGLAVTNHNWTLGTTYGFVGWDVWTLAGTVEVNYIHKDLSDFTNDALGMKVAIDGLYNFDQNWNIVAGLKYEFNLSEDYYENNPLTARLGFDYNFDSWKSFGVYVYKDLKTDFNDDNPFGVGMKFGIDF